MKEEQRGGGHGGLFLEAAESGREGEMEEVEGVFFMREGGEGVGEMVL